MAINTKIFWLGIGLLFLLAAGGGGTAAAQTSGEDWSPLINLSQSGAATSPVIVVVPEGPTIVLWLDEFDGLLFTQQTEGQWSPPKTGEFPFEGVVPYLVADGLGNIHAFWIDEQGALSHSSVSVDKFDKNNWTKATILDTPVTTLAVFVDAQNGLHVIYLRNLSEEETPAGLYYQKRGSGNAKWTPATLLYQSSYLRLLSADQIKLKLIGFETGEEQRSLFAMWDNRPLSQLLLSFSFDSGDTWGESIELRGPQNAAAAPAALDMTLTNEGPMILWQEKISDNKCRQFYQLFSLEGEVIGTPQVMLSEFPVCPESNQLITTSKGEIILQTNFFDFNYLLAWNGDTWSEPQIQKELSNLINPDTLQPLNLYCLRTFASGASNLVLIGCDNELGGDIWFTSREIDSTSNWFTSTASWSPPLSVFSTASDILSTALVADLEGQLHAFWAQSIAGTKDQVEIYYARWNGTEWSYIVSIINPPLGRAKELTAEIDPMGRIYVVWSGGAAGEIYFSWANADLAGMSSEWASPIILPMVRPVGASPDILIGENGLIYVSYSIPLNESRGIYLTTSDNGGESWSEPVQIVDGVATSMEIVGNVSLSMLASGELQVLFWQFPPPDGVDMKALYYARSEDKGQTWSTPEEIVRSELVQSWIQDFGAEISYRIWQEIKNGVFVTYLETSADRGKNWTEPENFTDFASDLGISDLVLDHSGQIHLVQLVDDANAGIVLQESVWDGKNWVNAKRQEMDVERLQGPWLLQTNITSDGFLGVLIARPIHENDTDGEALLEGSELIFTQRKIEETEAIILPTLTVEPTPEGTVLPSSDPTPTETSGATPTALPSDRPLSEPAVDTTILGPAVGLVASGFLVVLAFVIINKLSNRNG